MSMFLYLLAAAALSGCCMLFVNGAVESDIIEKLPGYKGDLPSTHYSGYLPVGELSGIKGHLHYWLIESENDPANDPVVLWLNGMTIRYCIP